MIHDWCGQLDDPANGLPCPCTANTTSRRDVERRHRAAVLRAKTRGWPTRARRRPARRLAA